MKNWYDDLIPNFEMSKISTASSGMDYYLAGTLDSVNVFEKPALPTRTYRVASAEQLKGFVRVAETDTLIRMSAQDLWQIKMGEDGSVYIERLFDGDGKPLKA